MIQNNLIRRLDYTLENMGRVFTVLENFGVVLNNQEKHTADQYFCSLDFADQLIEANLVNNAREHILAFVVGENTTLDKAIPKNAAENFTYIRGVVRRKRFEKQFEMYAREIFHCKDILPKIVSPDVYFSVSFREALLYAKMGLLFLPQEKLTPKVIRFLFLMNLIGRFADNLLDLEEDYETGRLVKLPKAYLRMCLKIFLFNYTIKAFLLIPQKRKVLGIGMRYLCYSLFK